MNRDFEKARPTEPEHCTAFQWGPALAGGLIAGLVLMIVPRGSPWSTLTFFTPVVAGRELPGELGLPLGAVMTVHLAVSMVYGLVIATVAARTRQLWSLAAGAGTGLVLYAVNYGIASTWFPRLTGNESSVIFTHAVLGLIAAGAYRGLLRRSVPEVDPGSGSHFLIDP